jgi:predicted kinase
MNEYIYEEVLDLSDLDTHSKERRLKKLVAILKRRPQGRVTMWDLSRRHNFQREELETLAKAYYHLIEILSPQSPHEDWGSPFVKLKLPQKPAK